MGFRLKGPVRAWRIASSLCPIFDRGGAAEYGARWNSPGRRVIYASEHYATAMLENLVHFNIGRLPRLTIAVSIDVPAELDVEVAEAEDVPGWDIADQTASRKFGDRWYDEGLTGARPAVLVVPSAVAQRERNVIINQLHPQFGRITTGQPEPVIWDVRLLGGRSGRRRR